MPAIVHQTWKSIGIAAICLASLAQPVRAGLFTDTAAGPQTMVLVDLALQHQRMVLAAVKPGTGRWGVLRDSQNRLTEDLRALARGGQIGKCTVPQPSQSVSAGVGELQKSLNSSRASAKSLDEVAKQFDEVIKASSEIEQQVSLLEELTQQFVILKARGGSKLHEVLAAQQLHSLLLRLASNALRISTAEGVSPEAAFYLGKDANTIENISKGFIDGSEVLRLSASKGAERTKAIELATAFERITKPVGVVLKNLQPYIAAKMAQSTLLLENDGVMLAIQKLRDQMPAGETCSLNRR